jgi:uncharacterized OsmC-like protein
VGGQSQPNSWLVAFDPRKNVAVGCLVLNAGYGAHRAWPEVVDLLHASRKAAVRRSHADSVWHPEPVSSGIGAQPVDRDELRSVQAPLKDRYREDPGAAVVTLRATGALGEGISCSIQTGRALAAAGLHPSTGGDGSLLCSGDMLLEALAACAGVTLRSVATSLGIEVRGGSVTAEGELDFRGTLAIGKGAPVGFRAIRVRFNLDVDATEEDMATLLRLTERYCVVLQTIAGAPDLTMDARRATSSA